MTVCNYRFAMLNFVSNAELWSDDKDISYKN